jgi:hypothetical protein
MADQPNGVPAITIIQIKFVLTILACTLEYIPHYTSIKFNYPKDNSMPTQSPRPPSYLLTAGGRIRCLQCNATSKRTGVKCRAAALRGKTKCASHGGRSTGPKTDEGKARIAAAQLVHGRETRQARIGRSLGLKRLAELEAEARRLGMLR